MLDALVLCGTAGVAPTVLVSPAPAGSHCFAWVRARLLVLAKHVLCSWNAHLYTLMCHYHVGDPRHVGVKISGDGHGRRSGAVLDLQLVRTKAKRRCSLYKECVLCPGNRLVEQRHHPPSRATCACLCPECSVRYQVPEVHPIGRREPVVVARTAMED